MNCILFMLLMLVNAITTNLLLLAFFVGSMLLMSVSGRKQKRRIVFLGDSITEQGGRPGGYLTLLREHLYQEGFDSKYELVNAGIAGNKVTDISKRLKKDVLGVNVYVLVLFIGVNDVWHKYSAGTSGTELTHFSAVYNSIVEQSLKAHIRVVLCTPAVIGEGNGLADEVNTDLNLYCQAIRKMAQDFDLPLVDVNLACRNFIAKNNIFNNDYGILTTDGVHLNSNGNQLLATEMWKVLQSVIQ